MKILVTGGAGFIGSAVVRHIINNTQDSVVNVDKLTYAGNLESLADVSDSERYVFEHADICDAAAMARIFAQHQPDAVMHLAAESHVDRSITGPAAFIETNIVGTYVLLEAARNYWSALDGDKKNSFRFHHISTDEVYGDLPHPDEVNNKEQLPLFTETTAYAPSSPYSASKASSDHLVRAWKQGRLSVAMMGRGYAWLDTGTHQSLIEASNFIATIEERQGLKVSCPEEIAYRKGFVDAEQVKVLAEPLKKNAYGQYLLKMIKGY